MSRIVYPALFRGPTADFHLRLTHQRYPSHLLQHCQRPGSSSAIFWTRMEITLARLRGGKRRRRRSRNTLLEDAKSTRRAKSWMRTATPLPNFPMATSRSVLERKSITTVTLKIRKAPLSAMSPYSRTSPNPNLKSQRSPKRRSRSASRSSKTRSSRVNWPAQLRDQLIRSSLS